VDDVDGYAPDPCLSLPLPPLALAVPRDTQMNRVGEWSGSLDDTTVSPVGNGGLLDLSLSEGCHGSGARGFVRDSRGTKTLTVERTLRGQFWLWG